MSPVNVMIMRELAHILPGITMCVPSLTSLKRLKCYKDVKRLQGQADLDEDQKYRQINDLISAEIRQMFGNISLQQYFAAGRKLTSSQDLIISVLCDRMTWKRKGKYAKYSLPQTCDNVFKIRSIDRDAGACFTLFHKAAIHALMHESLGDRFGVDDFEREDPEQVDLVNLGSHAPPMFVENGLLRITLNYNLESYRHPNQSTDLTQPYGGKFWIHSNRVIPHISTTGYELSPNKIYTIYLTKDVFHLMKPPYATNCRNYTAEYVQHISLTNPMDLSIPMSRETCIDECIVEKAMGEATCLCWPPVLPFRRDNQTKAPIYFCPRRKRSSATLNSMTLASTAAHLTCIQEAYKVVIKTINNTQLDLLPYKYNMSSPKGQKLQQQYQNEKEAIIDIVFLTNEETHHVHTAKVNFVEMSVDVAGLFGLFLAFSFDYFIDLFEYVRDVTRAKKRVSVM